MSLYTIDLPDQLETIGTMAFTYTSVEYLDIPASVSWLDGLAFEWIDTLDYIWFEGDAPEVNVKFLDSNDEDSVTICYHSSKSGWDEAKSSWSLHEGSTWYDIDAAISAIDFRTSAVSLNVGDEKSLVTNADSILLSRLTWTSSNKSIAYVSGDGLVTGLAAGTAAITVTSVDGVYNSGCTVTVKANSSGTLLTSKKVSKATVSDNISANNYDTWSTTVKSYLIANDDGTYTRLENISGTKLTVETWSASGKRKSKKTIKGCLSEFGGFYSGENYNFLVYGQDNSKCSNKKVVIRIVKYSKNWKKLGTVNVKNVNTMIPFHAGSLRMTEANGKLYIYTSRKMYDGHQSNMRLVVDESGMTYTYSSMTYVSHSFNQFITTDGDSMYMLDHGDAYPRAVVIHKLKLKPATNTSILIGQNNVLDIQGATGNNATGVSVGGFALSSDYCLVAGNSKKQSSKKAYKSSVRNIFISATNQSLGSSDFKWITNYTGSDNITVSTPQLVQISTDLFLLMWEESDDEYDTWVRMVFVDAEGTLLSDKIRVDARLSDCQPVVNASGKVSWYVSDGNKVTMYTVNPYKLLSAKNQSVKLKKSSAKKKISASKLKKSAQSFKLKTTARGKVRYKKLYGSSALTVTKKGKVKVKKGTTAGKYYMIVKIKASKKGNYPAQTITRKVVVTVK